MTAKATARCLLFVLMTLAIRAEAQGNTPPSGIESSTGKNVIKLLTKSLPGADDFNCFTIQVLAGDKILAQYPTCGFLINALWSPDNQYVAVNNRRGNSGDYLWVFSLKSGAALKKPDDSSYDSIPGKVVKKFPQLSGYKDGRVFTYALEWVGSNKLAVRSRVLLIGHLASSTAVEIFIDDTYKVAGNTLRQVSEEIGKPADQNLGYWPKIQ